MIKLGIIGGTNLKDSDFFQDSKKNKVKTSFGSVQVMQKDNVYYIQRHTKKYLPPHMINHRANIAAFDKLDIKHILAISSVGSLKKDFIPGRFVVPHDYINFNKMLTFFDKEPVFTIPSVSSSMREKIFEILPKIKDNFIKKAIFIQRSGPRYETRAETNFFNKFGDVVGMNMAPEATLAKELKMEYACVCMVDNFAHGAVEEELTEEFIDITQKKNKKKVLLFLEEFIKKWNGAPDITEKDD